MNVKRIFIDTWAWYAISNRKDKDHKQAVRINKKLVKEKFQYVTTNFIFGETYTLILIRGKNHKAAVDFGEKLKQMVKSGEVELIRISVEVENEACEIAKKYDDKNFSYVDCTSFAVMKKLGILQSFTDDSHFEQFGFQIVR